MIQRKFFKNALAAVVVAGAILCVLTGCNRESAELSSPESYMKDKNFVKTLEDQRRRQGELEAAHRKLAEQMTAMIEAKKKELKTEDLDKVRLELEKNEEWKSLYKRCLDAATAMRENRRKTEGIVRKRISK